jgi:hypothetical protein
MRFEGHKTLIGKPQGRGHVGDLIADGRIILKLILQQ